MSKAESDASRSRREAKEATDTAHLSSMPCEPSPSSSLIPRYSNERGSKRSREEDCSYLTEDGAYSDDDLPVIGPTPSTNGFFQPQYDVSPNDDLPSIGPTPSTYDICLYQMEHDDNVPSVAPTPSTNDIFF